MIIEIKNRELLIDGNSAGSVEDALQNYPSIVPDIWALMIERNTSRQALDVALAATQSELAALNARLSDQSGQILALSTDNADLAKQAALVPALQAELEALRMASSNPRVVSPSAFRARFTDEQLTAIATSAMADPTLFVFLIHLFTESSVNLDSDKTIAGLNYLAAAGIDIDGVQF